MGAVIIIGLNDLWNRLQNCFYRHKTRTENSSYILEVKGHLGFLFSFKSLIFMNLTFMCQDVSVESKKCIILVMLTKIFNIVIILSSEAKLQMWISL